MGQGAGLRIGMVTPWHVRCGVADYSANLSSALAELGVDTYVVRLHRLGSKGQEYYEHLASRRIPKGLDALVVQHEYGLYQNFERVFYALARDLHKVPIITDMHTTGWRWESDEAVSNLSDLVIVHNEHMKRQFGRPCAVVPHGVTVREPAPKEEAKRRLNLRGPTVGVFGFLAPNKRIEDFLLACRELPDVTPVVAGGSLIDVDTGYVQKLKRMGGDRVRWLGYVPDGELPAVMGALDVCVYPSGHISESGALLTMIGFGKAVIARDLPPNREKPCLELFEDVGDLSGRIRRLIDSPDERQALEERARRYARENSWSRIARQHMNYYKTAIKG